MQQRSVVRCGWRMRLPAMALIAALAAVATGCARTPRIPPDISADALKVRYSGIALVGLDGGGKDIFGRTLCGDGQMALMPLDTPGSKPVGDRATYAEHESRSLLLFERELPAGRYGITEIACTFGNTRTVQQAPPGQPFAVFSVGAGEVVDVGQLQVSVRGTGGVPILFATGYSAISFVDLMDPAVTAKIKSVLRSRLVSRPMIPNPVVPRQRLEEICKEERSRVVSNTAMTATCAKLAANAGPFPQFGPGVPLPPQLMARAAKR